MNEAIREEASDFADHGRGQRRRVRRGSGGEAHEVEPFERVPVRVARGDRCSGRQRAAGKERVVLSRRRPRRGVRGDVDL